MVKRAKLVAHPRCGASWEGFALEQVLRLAKPDEAYFWATHQGAELDLLMPKGSRRVGVEFKRADARYSKESRGVTYDYCHPHQQRSDHRPCRSA